MNKDKKINIFVIFSIILFLCLVGSIVFIFFNVDLDKDNLSVKERYEYLVNNYEKEKIRYDKILKYETIDDIYDYFMVSIDNGEYYPLPVMEYVFSTLFPSATAIEKFDLFYMYESNLTLILDEFYDYLNTASNVFYFDVNWNGYDFNSLEGIEAITKKDLQDILIHMKANNLIIAENYPEMLAQYDYQGFIDKYSHILDDDYINFLTLSENSKDMILNPGGTNYNALASIWYIHNYENYILTSSNLRLASAAQSIYEQNLALFLGQYSEDLFYATTTTYEVSPSIVTAYETYVTLYPNDRTTELLNNVLAVIYEKNGTEDLIDDINILIYDFITNAEWLPEDVSNEGMNIEKTDDYTYQ